MSAENTKPTFDKAWKLLEQKGWCQGIAARDADGKAILPTKPAACQFCAVGAIMNVYGSVSKVPKQAKENLDTYLRGIGLRWFTFGNVVKWNDAPGQTKEQVISVLKEFDI